MFPDFMSAHLILGDLGSALVQLAGLESQTKDGQSSSASPAWQRRLLRLPYVLPLAQLSD